MNALFLQDHGAGKKNRLGSILRSVGAVMAGFIVNRDPFLHSRRSNACDEDSSAVFQPMARSPFLDRTGLSQHLHCLDLRNSPFLCLRLGIRKRKLNNCVYNRFKRQLKGGLVVFAVMGSGSDTWTL